jgi:hypothetical protein
MAGLLRKGILKIALILSALRSVLVFVSFFLLQKTSGFGQIMGYVVLTIGTPECLMVRDLRQQPALWISALSISVVIGTFLVVWVLSLIFGRRSDGQA